ncbi:hypothetical protein CesoFtcFv8_027631 [Champsocephalus esox]|uniref:Uncharacterized protein n=1 Tax=Champsocephalus esox TaxID=159716 RepID=A0AAN7YE06_9TELE|nr:hypothetical protein CesoFtcFv8_027631 [Champsocephalus esox]
MTQWQQLTRCTRKSDWITRVSCDLKAFGGLQMDWCLQRELWRSSGLRGHSSDINEDVASGVSEERLRGHSSDINEDVASGVSEELTDYEDTHLTTMKTWLLEFLKNLRVKRGPPPATPSIKTPAAYVSEKLVDVFSLGEV